jgi:hypothetical protein
MEAEVGFGVVGADGLDVKGRGEEILMVFV